MCIQYIWLQPTIINAWTLLHIGWFATIWQTINRTWQWASHARKINRYGAIFLDVYPNTWQNPHTTMSTLGTGHVSWGLGITNAHTQFCEAPPAHPWLKIAAANGWLPHDGSHMGPHGLKRWGAMGWDQIRSTNVSTNILFPERIHTETLKIWVESTKW